MGLVEVIVRRGVKEHEKPFGILSSNIITSLQRLWTGKKHNHHHSFCASSPRPCHTLMVPNKKGVSSKPNPNTFHHITTHRSSASFAFASLVYPAAAFASFSRAVDRACALLG